MGKSNTNRRQSIKCKQTLSTSSEQPIIVALAQTLLKHRKQYYAELSAASKTLEITPWLTWFGRCVLEAQQSTLELIQFIIQKTKLLNNISS
jgi:Fic family protein